MIAEFYAIVAIVALIVVGPILFLVVPRMVRQLKREMHEEQLEQSQRAEAEKEYEDWVKANGIPSSDIPVDSKAAPPDTNTEVQVEQKTGDVN